MLVDKPDFTPPILAGWSIITDEGSALALVALGEAEYLPDGTPAKTNPELYVQSCTPVESEVSNKKNK